MYSVVDGPYPASAGQVEVGQISIADVGNSRNGRHVAALNGILKVSAESIRSGNHEYMQIRIAFYGFGIKTYSVF